MINIIYNINIINYNYISVSRRRRRDSRQRRQRTTFTSEQTLRLELEYHRNEYISRWVREFLFLNIKKKSNIFLIRSSYEYISRWVGTTKTSRYISRHVPQKQVHICWVQQNKLLHFLIKIETNSMCKTRS